MTKRNYSRIRGRALALVMANAWVLSRGCNAFATSSLRRQPKPRQGLFSSTASVASRSQLFPSDTVNNVMAPMVAASDYPYRCLLRQHGVDLCYTQMLHAKNMIRDATFRKGHIDLEEFRGIPSYEEMVFQQQTFLGDLPLLEASPEEQQFLKGPLMVQLAGSTPETVEKAASIVMDHAPTVTGIDLNLGCPQGIARKGNYGAFLCEQDFDGVCEILSSLSRFMESNYPETMVSAKIRLPLTDQILVEERIPRLIDTGISFLTIHGRTLHENKNKARECHVDRIKLAIETAHKIQPGFPVIANGGVETQQDVMDIRRDTNAIAVMSSEAVLETPNVFCTDFLETRQTARQRLDQQFGFAKGYLKWCQVCPPLPGVLGDNGSFNIAKGHLFKFLHRYIQENPHARDQLSSHKYRTIQDARDIVEELESQYRDMDDEELEACASSQPRASWYRRHWESMGVTHTRQHGGATSPGTTLQASMTLEEKKELMRQRISKLKEQKKTKAAAR